MTIGEAIERIDSVKHNTYTNADKIRWLSDLDGTIKRLIIDTHEGFEDVPFEGYTDATELATELLVPAPFDLIYVRWLEAQIDYYNGEYGKYNNAVLMYNAEYEAYANDYNRTHKPLGKQFKYFG
jgi:hypothetical protein